MPVLGALANDLQAGPETDVVLDDRLEGLFESNDPRRSNR
jgi:hypothetical protein